MTEDSGDWLVDQVNGATARWGLGPLCKGTCHAPCGRCDRDRCVVSPRDRRHANADAPHGRGRPPLLASHPEPVIEDRAAYLDEHLPADGAREPGVRCLGLRPALLYLAKDGRKQRTLSLYFGDDEITRMRDAYRSRMRLSTNDVVCAHVCEALANADPAVDRRTLAISVNTRNRCGLDPMLAGNILSALNVDIRRGRRRIIAEYPP